MLKNKTSYHNAPFLLYWVTMLSLSFVIGWRVQAADSTPTQPLPFDPQQVMSTSGPEDTPLSSITLLHLGSNDPLSITISIINVTLTFLGFGFLLLLIYAGVSYLMSQGNDEKIAKAKHLILRSILGFGIIVSALAISQFVFTTVSYLTANQQSSSGDTTQS